MYPKLIFKSMIRYREEYGTTVILSRGGHPPKVRDRVNRALIEKTIMKSRMNHELSVTLPPPCFTVVLVFLMCWVSTKCNVYVTNRGILIYFRVVLRFVEYPSYDCIVNSSSHLSCESLQLVQTCPCALQYYDRVLEKLL